jgi:hypothetical protein
MPTHCTYDYALIRVVPNIEKGEFVNVGVILFCRTKRYLAARLALDAERVLALEPSMDMAMLEAQLALIPRICAGEGPIGMLGQAESFHWLVAPHNTVVQAGPVHSGLCSDPEEVLNRLVASIAPRQPVEE